MDAELEQITAAAIARLAGVGRAAVSNWRKRYPDFPSPVGGNAASPLFSRRQVLDWLIQTGKADQLATAGRTDTGTQRIEELPADRTVTDLDSMELLGRVMAALLPRATAAQDAEGAAMAAVLDPACRSKTPLTAVAERFGNRITVLGQATTESDARDAADSLRAHIRPPYDIRIGDALSGTMFRNYLGRAAAVVCVVPPDPPPWSPLETPDDPHWEFGVPSARDTELAWVQRCYAHLRHQGVGIVAVSPRTCVQPSGQAIRAAIIRAGILRAVITLPVGLGGNPEMPPCLWLLQRPYDPTERHDIRLIDLTHLADPAEVPQDHAAWQGLFDSNDPAVSTTVSAVELLYGDTNVLPSRHLPPRGEANAADLTEAMNRLQALHHTLGHQLPCFAASSAPFKHAYVSLAELERSGTLRIRPKATDPQAGDLLIRTLNRPPIVATETDVDDPGIAYVVTTDPTRLDAHFLAMFIRTDSNAVPIANTLGAISRDDLRRCRIPRLPIAEQRRYGNTFRQLQDLKQVLTSLAKVGNAVIDQAVHGLTVGALSPNPPPLGSSSTDRTNRTEGETEHRDIRTHP
ncbi:N-6 DNA methylase [Nocardia beijingensis]|uniref:N-6 DNA methylase n=1 Tax=Nocardia beijingensis TaxID=95162 RepID=UPI00082F0870|nr:N-6 DNA methylase [Nocardia beijingensis]